MRVVNSSEQLSRIESGARPSTTPTEANGTEGDGDSEVGAVLDGAGDDKERDAKDHERWAKLKKLRQVFHVRRGKGKAGEGKEKRKSRGKENVVEVVD